MILERHEGYISSKQFSSDMFVFWTDPGGECKLKNKTPIQARPDLVKGDGVPVKVIVTIEATQAEEKAMDYSNPFETESTLFDKLEVPMILLVSVVPFLSLLATMA